MMKLQTEIMNLQMVSMNEYEEVANAKVSDINAGYMAYVVADGDISEKAEFTAKEISVNEVRTIEMMRPAIQPPAPVDPAAAAPNPPAPGTMTAPSSPAVPAGESAPLP
jgi:hypothetical protein